VAACHLANSAEKLEAKLLTQRLTHALPGHLLRVIAQEIYHRLSQWLLGYPLTGEIKTMLLGLGSSHIHRTQEAIANLLSGCHPQDLLTQMQAILFSLEKFQTLKSLIYCHSNLS
jgi:hypothetical protein